MENIIRVKNSIYIVRETEESFKKDGNMYGRILSWSEANKKYIPIICGHGGSMWLCFKCGTEMVG